MFAGCSSARDFWYKPDMTMWDAQSVGINYEIIKHIIMSETQAGEAFSASGGKLSHCQCKKDCLISKTCKCRKLKIFCGAKFHGGTVNNKFCRNCPPEWKVCCKCEPKKYNKIRKCKCEPNMWKWIKNVKVNQKCSSEWILYLWRK